MRKLRTATKTVKRNSLKPSRRREMGKPARKLKRRNFLKEVLDFRWLKKAMVGKTQEEALDLLDRWILEKNTLSLFL